MMPLSFPKPLSGRRDGKSNILNLNNSYFCDWSRVVKGQERTITSKNSA